MTQAVEIGRICYMKADGVTINYDLKRDIVIGRGPDCDIRIKQNTVSRVHCNLCRKWAEDGSFSGPYVLQNVSTTNLTEINYVATWGSVELADGDVLTIGERDFVFRLAEVEMSPEEMLASRQPRLASSYTNSPSGSGQLTDMQGRPPSGLRGGLGPGPPGQNSSTPQQEPGWCLGPSSDDDNGHRAVRHDRRPKRESLQPTSASAPDTSVWGCLPSIVAPLSMARHQAHEAPTSSGGSGVASISSSGGVDDGSRSRSGSSSGGGGGGGGGSGSDVGDKNGGIETSHPIPVRAGRKKKTEFTPETLQRDRELSRRAKAEAALRAANESADRLADPNVREKNSQNVWLSGWFFTL